MWGSCSRRGLAQVLHRFMQFYNFERPHHGYRVKGRTPATIFHGAVAVARWAHAPLWGGKSVNTNPNLDNLVDGPKSVVSGLHYQLVVAGLSRPAMQPLRPRGHQPPVRYEVGPVEAPTPTSHRRQCLPTGHDSRASTVPPGPTSAERPC